MDGVSKFKEFVHFHGNQLKSSGVPEHLWHTLSRKLEQQTFDAGNAFQLLMIDYDEGEKEPEDRLYAVVASKDIKKSSELEIYIIDHAWTYRVNSARRQLQQIPELLNRLANMMGASHLNTEDAIDLVMDQMWRYNQMYALSSTNDTEIPIEDRMPIW